jgi:hypothetical protein
VITAKIIKWTGRTYNNLIENLKKISCRITTEMENNIKRNLRETMWTCDLHLPALHQFKPKASVNTVMDLKSTINWELHWPTEHPSIRKRTSTSDFLNSTRRTQSRSSSSNSFLLSTLVSSWRWQFYGWLRRTVWYTYTDVSKVPTASIKWVIGATTQKTAVFILAAGRTKKFPCIVGLGWNISV